MNAVLSTPLTTPHDVGPDDAIRAILDHEGPVVLDLDETLYLGNSTEDYIDSARPGLLALVLLRLLDFIKPWRWTGGESTRDVWRVRLVRLLFPWTTRRWGERVTELAANGTNRKLLQALRARGAEVTVITIGFEHIVAPLIAAIGLPKARVVAARSSTFDDRRHGKLQLAMRALGDAQLKRALVLTDSSQDLPLLDVCARPLRTVWPEARYRHALSGVYLPGQYLTHVKRPGERYIMRGILQEDFAFWVLSSIMLASRPIHHLAGLLFLLLSFWAIYECGYVDNDLVAARHEKDPKLSNAFSEIHVATPRFLPWLWGAAAGVIGILFLRWPATPLPADYAKWAAVLLVTYGCFLLYNRFDKLTRVWLYSLLQLARSVAFVVLVPITFAGSLALGAHVMAKWLPYYAYRSGGRAWPQVPLFLTRLLFFVVLLVIMAAAVGPAFILGTWFTVLLLLGWCVFRARDELRLVIVRAARIDRETAPAAATLP